MLSDDRRVVFGDLQALKELLGVNSFDFWWLMGFSAPKSLGAKNPERARAEVPDAVHSILARLYDANPDISLLPRVPSPQDVYGRVKVSYARVTGVELSWRRFVLLCGLSQYSSHGWKVGEVPTMGAQRVLLLLDILLQRGGDTALRQYLRVLETEAKARGFQDLQELFTAGNWGKRATLRVDRKARARKASVASSRGGRKRSRGKTRQAT